ncbi:hypothetical protein BGX29_010169 [Mortierella sp. GBA35]|nr:hypothetical protein BGX29_010169 [Mortierella sp. GBA35]
MSLYGDLPPPNTTKEVETPVKKPEDGTGTSSSNAAKSTLPAGWSASITRFKPMNRKLAPPKQKPVMRSIPAGFVSQSTTTAATSTTESQNGVTTVYSAATTVVSSSVINSAQPPQDSEKVLDDNSWLRARTAQVQRQDNDALAHVRKQAKRAPVKSQQGEPMSLDGDYDIARPNEFEEFKSLYENERRQLEEERRNAGRYGPGPGYQRHSRSPSTSPYRSRSRGRRSRSRSYSRSISRSRSRTRSRSPSRRRASPSKERDHRGRSQSRSQSRSPLPPYGHRQGNMYSSPPTHAKSNDSIPAGPVSQRGEPLRHGSRSRSRSRDRRRSRSRSRSPRYRRMGRSRSRSPSRSPPYGGRRSPSPPHKRSRQHSPPSQQPGRAYKAFAPPPSQTNIVQPPRPLDRGPSVPSSSSSAPVSPIQNKPAFIQNEASGEDAFNRRAQLSQQRAQPVPKQQPQHQQQPQQQQHQHRPAFIPAAQANSLKGTPSTVILLMNMVGPGEVDDTLQEETAAECEKFGTVVRCIIFEVQNGKVPAEEAVRIFVKFGTQASAERALKDLDGRFFGGRQVRGQFFDERRFDSLQLAP